MSSIAQISEIKIAFFATQSMKIKAWAYCKVELELTDFSNNMQCLVKTSAPIPYPPLHVCMRLISVPASWSRSALFCQVAWLEAPPDIDTESWCIFSLGWYLIMSVKKEYRTCAIIRRGLYIFYPIFKNHFFVFKEVFSENSVLMNGLYSRAACNQEGLMMAQVR